MGVPVVGCTCAICKSSNPHNVRLRPSAMIKISGRIYLIDCGPDFRGQALSHGIDNLDGLILTHAHHDHTAGLDELRIFNLRSHKSLPCLLSEETLRELKIRFYYIFEDCCNPEGIKVTTDLDLRLLAGDIGSVEFGGMKINYMSYQQGGMQVHGFRFGDLAYLTDIKNYDFKIFDSLVGVKTLIISALRYTPSPLHFTVDDAVEFAKRVGAKQTWLTHIAHELDHVKTNAYLPESIKLSYDGLELPFF
ncbi:MAG: MBL fold metallo-hydrolase, partial [Parachlamydiaceae bacterium]|nr:MBL fold metallo-hydrolase [Parachlamydiaceae bacterium]